MANKKTGGLSDRLKGINKKTEIAQSIPKPVIQEVKVKKKQGRPTYKISGVNYERIFADIPEELKASLEVLRVTKFRQECKTQSELITRALEEFVRNNAS